MNPVGHLLADFAALIVIMVLALFRLRRLAFTVYDVIDGAFFILMGVFAGAWAANAIPRIVGNLMGSSVYTPWWAAGEHWMGAVTGGALVGYWWAKRRRLPVGVCFDALAPLLPITLAIIRVGCFLNADAFGRETASWIGMWLPDPNGVYAMRYPTQLVSLVMNLLLAGLLFGFEFYNHRRGMPLNWPFPGFLFFTLRRTLLPGPLLF
ncbi:MAG: prolipoprotein diacylglyceryl transferase [Anaerolineales bacterium]|nr:prolipoprotein diacylglyceryl transferase [Anaerolineales bacterium]